MNSTSFAKLTLVTAVALAPLTANAAPESGPGARAVLMDTGAVSSRSPRVTLAEVGKEIGPGVFEVAPESLRGRRLDLTDGGGKVFEKKICIGYWNGNGGCVGIYIEKDDKKTTK